VIPFIISSPEAKMFKNRTVFMVRVWLEFSRRDTHRVTIVFAPREFDMSATAGKPGKSPSLVTFSKI